MNKTASTDGSVRAADSGLLSLLAVASYYRIAGDVGRLEREMNLSAKATDEGDLQRAAALIGMKSRLVRPVDRKRLAKMPLPAIVRTKEGAFQVLAAPAGHALKGEMRWRVVDPVTKAFRDLDTRAFREEMRFEEAQALLLLSWQ